VQEVLTAKAGTFTHVSGDRTVLLPVSFLLYYCTQFLELAIFDIYISLAYNPYLRLCDTNLFVFLDR
jgi:hypothetical protein